MDKKGDFVTDIRAIEIDSYGILSRPNLHDAEVRAVHFLPQRANVDIITMYAQGPFEFIRFTFDGVGRIFCQTDHLQNVVDHARIISDEQQFESYLSENPYALAGPKAELLDDVAKGLRIFTFAAITGLDFFVTFNGFVCRYLGPAPAIAPNIVIAPEDRL